MADEEARMPYDCHSAPVRQSANWNCSCASAAWALQSVGLPMTEAEVTADMVARGLVTPEYGLMDGSGAGLAGYLRELTGRPVIHKWMTWHDLVTSAGRGPICQGSNSMYHWSAIRYLDDPTVQLMNPAPGWMGVYDSLEHYQWESWGPWAGVLVAEDDDVTNAELVAENEALRQQVDELTGQLADERQWGSSVLNETCIPVTRQLDTALATQRPEDWSAVASAANSLHTNLYI